ncbi:pentatricopeptide repeat-containing protein At1g43980, mitochondrial-like [Phalaenopsis equestris]|uniref:pentatricopeptide repeat-containing protein At1g43980, mitochondrial-like n=1 Tax=Phalaenopsis equestris TaxID=78828 RepID=UPI0009E6295E|nr:pentatricopeptide repeat-containing protein At1g43980, mitochondrial-like [Phalaenopsis equestris]
MSSPSPAPNPKHLYPSSSSSLLIDRCLSFSSLQSTHAVHARLLKLGLHRNTFLCNRLLHLYSRLASLPSVLRAFSDISAKNIYTWNILLSAVSKAGRPPDARKVFDEMPARDTVSWNSMMSCYAGNGLFDVAFAVFYAMRELGLRGNAYTISISASCVFSQPQAKQIHGNAIRCGFDSSSVVVGNSLINMYGKIGLVDCAYCVFRRLESPDAISWNSMISAFGDSGHGSSSFECFRSMLASGLSPDEFSISAIISVCADLKDLVKGEQVLDDSIRLFREMERWDSATLNSVVSVYAKSGLVHEALNLFVMAVGRNVRPTEFTFASILGSNSCFGLPEQGRQIHCFVHKLGMEADVIISTALVDMYMKLGSEESATNIFSSMIFKDLISWNTMIIGLAQNGQGEEGLRKFQELLESGIKPDRITLLGVLLACSHRGMVSEGKKILYSMEEKHGIKCGIEHYSCAVEMMGRSGRLEEAIKIIETMPFKPNASMLGLLLEASSIHGSLSFTEKIAEKMMELEPQCSLPYNTLGRMYGRRGMWESMAWIWRIMEERGVKRVSECSWIGIKNQIFTFSDDEVLHHGGEVMYSILGLLIWELAKEGYGPRGYGEGFEEDEDEEDDHV